MKNERYGIMCFRGEDMIRNLFIVLTYIGVFFLTGVFIYLVDYWYPEVPDMRILLWAQSFMGIAGFIFMIILFRKYIVAQTKKLLKEPGKTFVFGIVGYGFLFISTIIIGVIFSELGISGESENQSAIISLFTNIDTVDLILLNATIIFFTPVVEELTFRKGLYGLVAYIYMHLSLKINPDKDHSRQSRPYLIATIVAIIVSGLTFGYIHVSGGDYINLIPYGTTGIILGILYYKSGHNIYVPIIAHVINNLIGVVVILLY